MISVDTVLLRELVTAASVANDAIDNAVDALNRVSVHNDWGCKEKQAINDYAITNRNKVKQLQENSRGFLSIITQVSNEFETSENAIIDLFSSVESLLSGMLSIPVSVITNGHAHTGTNQLGFTENFADIISKWQKENNINLIFSRDDNYNPFENFELNNFSEPISMCNFDDINLG